MVEDDLLTAKQAAAYLNMSVSLFNAKIAGVCKKVVEQGVRKYKKSEVDGAYQNVYLTRRKATRREYYIGKTIDDVTVVDLQRTDAVDGFYTIDCICGVRERVTFATFGRVMRSERRLSCEYCRASQGMMNTAQACAFVGVRHSTFSRWVKQGIIAPARRFRGYYFRKEDVESLKLSIKNNSSPVCGSDSVQVHITLTREERENIHALAKVRNGTLTSIFRSMLAREIRQSKCSDEWARIESYAANKDSKESAKRPKLAKRRSRKKNIS